MSLNDIIEQIRDVLPPDRQAINRSGELIVVIEREGKMPIMANLSRLNETRLLEIAAIVGVVCSE